MSKPERIFIDLVIAMLAVNRWTLDRAFALNDDLTAAGFLDPAAVRAMTVEEVASRLVQAGYRRGQYMEQLLAVRIAGAAHVLEAEGMRRLVELERRGDKDGIQKFLLTIKGVGPEVANSFLVLRS